MLRVGAKYNKVNNMMKLESFVSGVKGVFSSDKEKSAGLAPITLGFALSGVGLCMAAWYLLPLLIQTMTVGFSVLGLIVNVALTILFASASIACGGALAMVGFGLVGAGLVPSENQDIIDNAVLNTLATKMGFADVAKIAANFKFNLIPTIGKMYMGDFSDVLPLMKHGLGYVDLGLSYTLTCGLSALHQMTSGKVPGSLAEAYISLDSAYGSFNRGVDILVRPFAGVGFSLNGDSTGLSRFQPLVFSNDSHKNEPATVSSLCGHIWQNVLGK